MIVELWIALFASLAIGTTVGFIIAKRNAPKKSELDALRDQLHAAQTETAEVREGVSDHFEQSAVLFGRLAQDYRSFIEHFSESAQTLGISEGHARELLEQASQPLVGHDAADTDAIEGAAVASVSDIEEATDVEDTVAAESGSAAAESEETEPEPALADPDELLDLSQAVTPADVSESTEPVTEEITSVDKLAESSVAEVNFEPPERDEIAEQKAS